MTHSYNDDGISNTCDFILEPILLAIEIRYFQITLQKLQVFEIWFTLLTAMIYHWDQIYCEFLLFNGNEEANILYQKCIFEIFLITVF